MFATLLFYDNDCDMICQVVPNRICRQVASITFDELSQPILPDDTSNPPSTNGEVRDFDPTRLRFPMGKFPPREESPGFSRPRTPDRRGLPREAAVSPRVCPSALCDYIPLYYTHCINCHDIITIIIIIMVLSLYYYHYIILLIIIFIDYHHYCYCCYC